MRQLPHLTKGPFRYGEYAVEHLKYALTKTSLPVKQAVISASALSMIYPPQGIPGYSRDEFLCDLVNEVERDIRQCLEACADSVQMDFTEARMAIKLDPSLKLLEEMIEINNWVLDRFSPEDRKKIGIHSCPGSDCDCTHSADIDYEFLLPGLFRLHAGRFYIQLSSEKDRPRVLASIRAALNPTSSCLSASSIPPTPTSTLPKKCATASSKPPAFSLSTASAPPMIAASLHSPTIAPPRAKPPSPKSKPASTAPPSPAKLCANNHPTRQPATSNAYNNPQKRRNPSSARSPPASFQTNSRSLNHPLHHPLRRLLLPSSQHRQNL